MYLSEKNSVSVDDTLHADLCCLMEDHQAAVLSANADDGSFSHVLWQQQMEASRQHDARTMRWHPLMIKWCLHLRLKSSGAYRELRESGILRMPSERTLRDYTNCVPPKAGYQAEVEAQLVKDTYLDSLQDWEKFVVVVFDEMKIREGLVYDKYNDQLLGFVTLDDISNRLLDLERKCSSSSAVLLPDIATHMLVLMVRGLFISLKFPFAQFPTTGVAAYQLYPLITDAILRLEMLGFKVICLTSNGASPNRKLYKMLQSNFVSDAGAVPYKMKNTYTVEDRCVYLMPDVPHLLKTTRNCWANSHAHSQSRCLWVSFIYLGIMIAQLL